MHDRAAMSCHPYRDQPPVDAGHRAATCQEESVIYAMLIVVGAIPIWLTVHSGALGSQFVFGAVMVLAGLAGCSGAVVQFARSVPARLANRTTPPRQTAPMGRPRWHRP
jgi:hypothetical protein